jgi:hypothetical protein
MPYALASGFFPPHSRAAHGIVRYVLGHGSRLLGVPRADAHIVYANKPYGSGLGQVYGLSMSRFMADNDHPEQLVLSLYGMLAIGMTPGTYIAGEAISVVPVNGDYVRSMYMPPNSGANASYLETFVTAAPTSFGPVSYSLSRSGPSVEVSLVLPEHAHARLRVRVPAGDRVTGVWLGARRLPFSAAATVDLGALHGPLAMHAVVTRGRRP